MCSETTQPTCVLQVEKLCVPGEDPVLPEIKTKGKRKKFFFLKIDLVLVDKIHQCKQTHKWCDFRF